MAASVQQESTSVSFNEMLKQYLPYKLLSDEIIKRDYFLSRVSKDQNWRGGELQVPFVGANASAISLGGLTAEDQISEDEFVRGTVSSYKELWGSMVFNQRDLDQHGNLEASFLKILPDRIDVFAQTMKEALSGALLSGRHIDVATANGSAAGVVGVNRPELFQVGQRLHVTASLNTICRYSNGAPDPGSELPDFYVVAINLGGSTITVSASSGGAGLDVSSIIQDTDKIYRPGSVNTTQGDGSEGNEIAGNCFTSLPDQLLASNLEIFGQTKLKYPHLQAYNVESAGDNVVTSSTILDVIFDTQTKIRRLGRGNPTEAIMSYRNFAYCMKILEDKRQYQADVSKASKFGWTEITVVGVKGALKLVAVPEMFDSQILILDMDSMKLHSNGMVERREAPDGKQFFETRAVSGYKYILDHRFYGDLVVSKPSNNGIIHSIA